MDFPNRCKRPALYFCADMKISYNWLKQYHNLELDPKSTSDILTQTGLEVEGLEKTVSAENLNGVVVGEVLEKSAHPDADRLSVTKVNIGNGEALNIVCGAPNVEAGQKVLVATVGSTLQPTGGEPFKIKKAKIRGVESIGMICAEDELGLGEDHDGIMVLEPNANVGSPAAEYLKIEEDFCIEIGLTPNRADAMGHIGTARDLVAAVNNNDEIEAKGQLLWPELSAFASDENSLEIEVEVADADACPRYAGLTVSGLKVGPSPKWLQDRLNSIGLKPINNVVDITNFVQHEYGQPLHAFDAAKIDGQKVVLRKAKDGEKFTTLDEVERELSANDLMICNAEKAMCIAGVFGGLESGVSEGTTAIFLESAYFDPVSIRKTARRHGLNTDASFRFERGVDPNKVIDALKRAALLLKEVCGGNISSGITDLYPNTIRDNEVSFSYGNCHRLCGVQIPEEKIKSILNSLDIEVVSECEDQLQLKVPAYRVDVTREADVIEEVLRIYGFNNVPSPEKLNSSISYSSGPDLEAFRERISTLLIAEGFKEMMNNSLTSSAFYEFSSEVQRDSAVQVLNPLSSELDTMRQTLLFGGLGSIAYNRNRQSADLRFYEFGKTYFKRNNGYEEFWKIGLFLTGNAEAETWNSNNRKVEVFDLKAALERLFAKIGLASFSIAPSTRDIYSSGFEIKIGKQSIGHAGQVDQKVLSAFDVEQSVFFAELDRDPLVQMTAKREPQFSELPKYPSARRDLSLLLNEDVRFADIERIARKQEKRLLTDIGLFDVYEGKGLPEGKKSYAVSFTMQDLTTTLTDKQVDKVLGNIRQALEKELGAQLR